MKKTFFIITMFLVSGITYAQSFNEDKTAFTNFIKRMYTATPFEGVKIIDDFDHQFIVSVITLEKAKYTNESMIMRVAQVKAQSQVSAFLNGSNISMDMIIKTTEKKDSTGKTSSITESIESIKQNSTGFSQGLELLTNFDVFDSKRMVFFYYREMKK